LLTDEGTHAGGRTEALIFYHGTGTAAAGAILTSRSGDSGFEAIGAFDLGRAIRRALLRHAKLSANDDFQLNFIFNSSATGVECSSPWVEALRQLDSPEAGSYFTYGHFFATLNKANAYRYAVCNPYRSEFIQVLAETLKLLASLGDALAQSVAYDYPEIANAIENPSPPVVLELMGIARERLLTAQGSHDIEPTLEFFRDMEMEPGVSVPADFTIRDVTSADVVVVHDLRDWPMEEIGEGSWRPDESKVADVRFSVRDWLAESRERARSKKKPP
jgi:hypothetical protein